MSHYRWVLFYLFALACQGCAPGLQVAPPADMTAYNSPSSLPSTSSPTNHNPPATNNNPPAASSLRAMGSAIGLTVGTAVKANWLANPNEAEYTQVVAGQFNSLTPTNEMKWDAIHPQMDVYNFAPADSIVDFAIQHGQKIHGHTLVWHSQNPTWLTSGQFSASEKLSLLKTHITSVMTHYKQKYPGQVYAWDVVNEAMADTGFLRTTLWTSAGATADEYISKAFEYARAADANALLFYNDYANDGLGTKSNAIYAMIRRMKLAGVPIDGIGMQAHLSTDNPAPTIADLRANIQRYAAIGVKVQFTELDARTNAADGVSALEIQRQNEIYTNIITACRAERPNCLGIITWGVSPKDSWIPSFFPGYAPLLPFDSNFQPTQSYTIIQNGLK